ELAHPLPAGRAAQRQVLLRGQPVGQTPAHVRVGPLRTYHGRDVLEADRGAHLDRHGAMVPPGSRPRQGGDGAMVLPRSVARLNRRFLNRVVIRLAPFLPGLGVFHHRGRRTGRRYAIPINVFPRGDRYVFALTYGPGTDWLRNVQAAGRCTLLTRGTVVPLHRPRVYRDERMSDMPLPARVVLRRV